MYSETITDQPAVSVSLLFNELDKIKHILKEQVEEDQMQRRLSPDVIKVLREAGFLRLFLPKPLSGLEADPITAAWLVEEVARYNTAAAWMMMVANTAAWWCARLSDAGVTEVFANGADIIIAGAFHPPMKAIPIDGGYLVNGRSPLASNVHEAQWIFVTAFVMEGELPKMNNGIPAMVGVFMKAGDCHIIDTWHTIGMKATDSNDISAANVFVPHHLSFALVPSFNPNSYYRGSLYRFPAIGASIASLITPVALAVARNAIEELKVLAQRKIPFGSMVSIKEKGSAQRKLGIAEAMVQSGRAYVHNEIAACWNKVLNEEEITLNDRARLLLAVTHTNQTCAQATDLMYSAGGTSGIYLSNALSRHFTDAQVIRQHGFSNESRYETAAQIYFELPPDLPVILF
jgi:alkylation response protein AidB-like acyl-CoA dehydrogenase